MEDDCKIVLNTGLRGVTIANTGSAKSTEKTAA